MNVKNALSATLLAVVLLALVGCQTAPNRFIILSDLHPNPSGYEQLEALTQHVIDLEPAFVFVLGDIGGDEVPGRSEREIECIRDSFNRMRASGIEVYPVMGNHDVHPRVERIKVDWFLDLLSTESVSEACRAFQDEGPYDYAFTRGGIHFAVVDSNCIPPRPNWDVARIEREQPRWTVHHAWMTNTFCRHAGNPDRLPTLVFLHHPEYMTGDRNMTVRPLGVVLDGCVALHTVCAVFGGHWHNGQNLEDPRHRDTHVYATQVTVHPSIAAEFIVADVSRREITFHTRDSATGQPTESKLAYHTIKGKFQSLRE